MAGCFGEGITLRACWKVRCHKKQVDGLGCEAKIGLSVRLLVRFGDGRETVIRPHFPIRFERVLPLKVDWLDFIRIAEVAHLLKEKGKEIWEGFSLEGIPFLLEGAEGQWVLINHPKPPKGFERYKGPLPKVSFPMTVYVGQRKAKERQREEVMGWVEKVNGVWVAGLRYFPRWWVLTDCASGRSIPSARQPNALHRLRSHPSRSLSCLVVSENECATDRNSESWKVASRRRQVG
jgi:hypothetical protein